MRVICGVFCGVFYYDWCYITCVILCVCFGTPQIDFNQIKKIDDQ